MIDIDEQAAALSSGIAREPLVHLHEKAPIERAGQRIVRAHLDQGRLEPLSRRDVDEDAVNEPVAGLGIVNQIARVEHGSRLAVGTAHLDLEFTHGAVALEELQLCSAARRIDKQVRRAKLAELPGRANAKMSNKRINGILAPLRQILNDAADRHGFVSPTSTLKPLRIRKTDVEPFTLDEVQRLLATVRADYHDYFTTRFLTGMRTGEAHGLKWKYVDFENRLILIRETFVLGEDEYTKTDSSQRDLQMSQPVYESLKRQHEATGKLGDYVFCNREGQPLDNKNFSDRVWYPLLRHLGLKARRPYQMRHTAATLWLASGEAPEWIARQLGHSSTEMLFRVYSRYVPNLTRRDGSAIDRLLATRFASGGSNANANGAPAANDGQHADKRPPAQPPPERALLAA